MSQAPAVRVPGWLRTALSWLLFAGFLVIAWPSSLGGCTTLTTVTGHSMEPTLRPGDLAIVRCGTPQEGDVVAYRPYPDQSALVIHRIVGGSAAEGWRLQGDNNDFLDVFRPKADQVKGVMMASVPGIGGAIRSISNPLVWGTLLVLSAALMLWLGAPERRGAEDEDELEPAGEAAPALMEPVS